MDHDLSAIGRGWAVYDANNDRVGDVADVGTAYLLVQKGLLFVRDVYIPATAVAETDEADGRVYLSVAKRDIDSKRWDAPPATAASMTGGASRTDLDYGITATAGAAQGAFRDDAFEEGDTRVPFGEAELRRESRSADLVGAGADRFERTSVDDIAGIDRGTEPAFDQVPDTGLDDDLGHGRHA